MGDLLVAVLLVYDAPPAVELRRSIKLTQENDKHVLEVLALAARFQTAGRLEDAARILMTARRSQPRNVDVLSALASLARRRGALDEAVQWLEEAAEIAPDEPAVVGNLGNLYRASGALDRAVACYRRVLEAVPDSVAAFNNLGLALKSKGDIDDAIAVYRRALEIDPTSAEVQCNLGAALLVQGAPEEARGVLEGALRTQPGSVEARTNLGSALRALGRHEEAIEAFRMVVATAPDRAGAHSDLADALQHAGRPQEAIKAYLEALRREPNSAPILDSLAKTYAAVGQYDKAASMVERAKALADGSVDTAMTSPTRQVGAAGDFESAADRVPDDPRSLEGLAYAHFLLGEDDEARRLYQRVLALDPDAATARHILNSLSGRTSEAAPARYVQAMYDEYAPRFEHSLLNELSYSGPAMAREILTAYLGGTALENVLDLGCGTGLIGDVIKEHFPVGYLEGVDLSSSMIEQAAAKGLYDALTVADIVAHLDADDRRFDLITAADVFIYTGDLAPVFRGVRRRLARDGHFFFTVEALDGDEFKLQRTARYAHSKAYIDRLAAEQGFRGIDCRTHDIRRDSGRAISGYAFLLQRTWR